MVFGCGVTALVQIPPVNHVRGDSIRPASARRGAVLTVGQEIPGTPAHSGSLRGLLRQPGDRRRVDYHGIARAVPGPPSQRTGRIHRF